MVSVNNTINRLNATVTSFANNFSKFPAQFGSFHSDFSRFVTAYLKNNGGNNNSNNNNNNNNNGNGNGNGGGDDDSKDMMGKVAGFFNSQMIKMKNTVMATDDLEASLQAQNTSIKDLNLPKNFNIAIFDLAKEVSNLRELGIKNLDDTTYSLIATMKRTNQNTAGLNSFLSKSTAELGLTRSESINLQNSLSTAAKSYGVSQEKVFEMVNSISKTLQPSILAGNSAEMASVRGEIGLEYGSGQQENIDKMMNFILNPINTFKNIQFAGITDLVDKFIDNPSKEVFREINNTLSKAYAAQVSSYKKTGLQGGVNRARMDEFFANMGAIAISLTNAPRVEKSTIEPTHDPTTLIKDAMIQYNNSIQEVAISLHGFSKLLDKSTMGNIGKVAGTGSVISSAVGVGLTTAVGINMAKKIAMMLASRVATGAIAGSVAPGVGNVIGAIVGVGSAAWGIYELWKEYGQNADDAAAIAARAAEVAAESLTVQKKMLVEGIPQVKLPAVNPDLADALFSAQSKMDPSTLLRDLIAAGVPSKREERPGWQRGYPEIVEGSFEAEKNIDFLRGLLEDQAKNNDRIDEQDSLLLNKIREILNGIFTHMQKEPPPTPIAPAAPAILDRRGR